MSRLHRHLRDYLALRRGLGFKLQRDGLLLPDFLDFLGRFGAVHITTALALAWAKQPAHAHPSWWAMRLTMVRSFASYVQALDPCTDVPPRDLLSARSRRAAPYLYSDRDILRILAATHASMAPFRAETYATLVALLAVTGMRVGEAITLDRDDVDAAHGVLTVRGAKFGKSREIPLHPTAAHALDRYATIRDDQQRRPRAPAFLLSGVGTRLIYQNVHRVFHALVRAVGLGQHSTSCRPRIHDLRHTFAVRTLIGWYRDGDDVAALMPRLSTYLGHVDPVSTYWYLSATPELLDLAARRAERATRSRS